MADAEAAHDIGLPAVAVYEARRELYRGAVQGTIVRDSLLRLEELMGLVIYLPLDRETEEVASVLWAQARRRGVPTYQTTGDRALDFDVLIAAHAVVREGVVLTNNVKHLERYGRACHWGDLL